MESKNIQKRLEEIQNSFLKNSPKVIKAIQDFAKNKIPIEKLIEIYNKSLERK